MVQTELTYSIGASGVAAIITPLVSGILEQLVSSDANLILTPRHIFEPVKQEGLTKLSKSHSEGLTKLIMGIVGVCVAIGLIKIAGAIHIHAHVDHHSR